MQITEEQKKAELDRRDRLLKEYLHSEEYRKKLILRAKLNDAGKKSLESRAYIWHLCNREDNTFEGAKFFIENFLYTFNPKLNPKHFPFILYPFQEDAVKWFIEHVDNGRDGLIEKSREMGATWIFFAAMPLYYWLFRDGTNILVGSYKEMLVDDNTPDSIFGKIDYLMQGLPRWLLPKNFTPKKHRTKLKLRNPNGNLISGDTMNPNFGRGARKTCILFDELGFWDYAKDAWEAGGDSTNCRIANSTPHGYNYYAMLRESGMDVLTLHWKEHPLKDQPWYDFEKLRRTEEEVAQELDISYSKSREGKVYPEWNDVNVQKGLYEYQPDLPLYVGWDFGRADDTAIIWAQKTRNDELIIVDTYRNNGKNIDFYIPLVTGIVPGEWDYKYTKEELELIDYHKNWKRATHFGDPAGRFRNQVSDETVITKLRDYGIIVNFKDKWKEFNIRKNFTKKQLMQGVYLNDNARTKYFDICILNSSYPKVKSEGVEQVRSEKPKHDAYSHYRSSLEYLCIGLQDIGVQRVQPYDKFPRKELSRESYKKNVVSY